MARAQFRALPEPLRRLVGYVWHINEIANFDPQIVPFLYALPGQRFDRTSVAAGEICSRSCAIDAP